VSVPDGKDIGLAAELGRKAIHLFGLVVPLGMMVVPPGVTRWLLVAFFLISVAIDLLRRGDSSLAIAIRRLLGPVLRPHELSRFSGGTYILAAGALCSLLFTLPVAVAALIAIILGDTAAVFVGRYLGRIRIGGSKTLEGSLGFFAAALLGILWMSQLPIHVKVIGSAAAAFTEALPLPLDDNLTVPLVAGTVMTLLLS
jgi:dolichol kinase